MAERPSRSSPFFSSAADRPLTTKKRAGRGFHFARVWRQGRQRNVQKRAALLRRKRYSSQIYGRQIAAQIQTMKTCTKKGNDLKHNHTVKISFKKKIDHPTGFHSSNNKCALRVRSRQKKRYTLGGQKKTTRIEKQRTHKH